MQGTLLIHLSPSYGHACVRHKSLHSSFMVTKTCSVLILPHPLPCNLVTALYSTKMLLMWHTFISRLQNTNWADFNLPSTKRS